MLHTTVQSQRRKNGGENSYNNVDCLTDNFFLFLLHDIGLLFVNYLVSQRYEHSRLMLLYIRDY